jgi:hypothetical protein
MVPTVGEAVGENVGVFVELGKDVDVNVEVGLIVMISFGVLNSV